MVFQALNECTMNSEDNAEVAKRQGEKAQKRSRKPSRFRRISISRGRYYQICFLIVKRIREITACPFKRHASMANRAGLIEIRKFKLIQDKKIDLI